MDPNWENAQLHNNVLHIDGGQSNVTFDNNIMWYTESRAQTVLIQDSPMDNITIANNLDVEAPNCETDGDCNTDPYEVYAPHGLTFETNTTINAAWGIELAPTSSTSYSSGENMTAEDNITVPVPADGPSNGGETNYSVWGCSSSCTAQDNVSADTSANDVFGGSGNIVNSTPSWTTTSWTPVSGPGYELPPPGYYQPVGLVLTSGSQVLAGAGYVGYIGP